MNYTKPEVSILGESKAVIEQINPLKPVGHPDNLNTQVAPAYDLDE